MGALLDVVGPLVGPALRAFLATTAGMIVLTLLVMGASVVIAAPSGPWAMAAAGLLSLVVGVVAGSMLALKRTIATALTAGLERLGLGGRALRMIFDRLLAVREEDSMGERGAAGAKMLERVPLAEAEARLERAVENLLAERARQRGLRAWLARKLQAAALERVKSVTLARFRSADAEHGGVDLILVRDGLGDKVDAMLVDTMRAAATKVTALALSLVLLLSLGGAFAIRVAFEKLA